MPRRAKAVQISLIGPAGHTRRPAGSRRGGQERGIGRLQLQPIHHQLQGQVVAGAARAGVARVQLRLKPYLSISSQFMSHRAEHQIAPAACDWLLN